MVSWPRSVDPDAPGRRPRRRWTLLLIGIGGAAGTLLRFGIEAAVPVGANGWPSATFVINITGALVLAAFLELLVLTGPDSGWRRRLRLTVGTGMLGGFTTYSSFMVEAALLGGAGQYLIAFGYAALSVVLGFTASWIGISVVNALHRRHLPGTP